MKSPLRLTPTESRRLWVLAAVQFVHIVDFMVIMPLGPQIMREFAMGPAGFGLLVSAYSLSAGLLGLFAAGLLDGTERRRLLLFLLCLFGGATALCGLVQSQEALLIARCLAGAFGGLLGSLVHTIAGDLVPEQRRGQASGIILGAFAVSTVLGVPLSLALAEASNWRVPFLALAALTMAVALLSWRCLPELAPKAELSLFQRLSIRGTWVLLKTRSIQTALVFSGALLFSSFLIIPYITVHLVDGVGVASAQIPWVYLIGGAATFLTARWIGLWADRAGKPRVFQWVAMAAMVPLVALPQLEPGVNFLWVLVCTTLFFTLVSGRTVPAMALLVSAVPSVVRGRFLSVNAAAQQLAMGSAALVGGLLISPQASGQLKGYANASVLAVGLSIFVIYWVRRIKTLPTE